MESNKRILITGGLGFLGLHLARRLLARKDCVVTVVDNFSNSRIDGDVEELLASYPATFKVIQGDISRDVIPFEVDEVYHFGAVRSTKYRFHGAETLEKNFLSTLNIIKQFKDKPNVKILFASTGETSGGLSNRLLPTPESTSVGVDTITDKRWTYAMSKVCGEMLFLHSSLECKYVIARIQNPYGPRMGWENVMPIFIKKILTGENVISTSSPHDTRPFLYIDDTINAFILLMENQETNGQIYNVSGLKEVKIWDMMNLLREIAFEVDGKNISTNAIVSGHGAVPEIRNLAVDKLSSLGWKEKVELKAGLLLTYEWYKKHIEDEKN